MTRLLLIRGPDRTWLVDNGSARAVLKIDDGPRSAPFNSRKQEAQVQSAAAAQDLANAVLHVGHNVYMTEYVDGQLPDGAPDFQKLPTTDSHCH